VGTRELLRRILAAGVAEYGVWLGGRVAIYIGRAGESYVEKFPDATRTFCSSIWSDSPGFR